MRIRSLSSALLIVLSAIFIVSCVSSGVYTQWANNYRSLNARFHRVAVYTDVSVIRPSKAGPIIAVSESLAAGKIIDDQIAGSLGLLDYDVVSNEKFFIGTYAVEKMKVADSKDEKPAFLEPPFHIDPDVSHTKVYEKSVVEAMRAFAAMAAGGPDVLNTGNIDPLIIKTLSAKHNADAIALAVGISRRIPNEPEQDGTINSSRLYKFKVQVLCVGIFHGFNGKLLWYGQKSFTSPVLDSHFKSAAKTMLADFPARGEGPYFAKPED